MKRIYILPLIGLVSLLSSCVVDRHGRVWPAPLAVGVGGPGYYGGGYGPGYYGGGPGYYGGGPGYYGGGWGPYGAPYFMFGGLNYYNYGGRYCYYNHGHRVYVSHLPSGGHYYHAHH